jgi:hypothetical protein
MNKLYDRFLTLTLSSKEEKKLLTLLKEKNYRQDFKMYMLEQRDLNMALLELDRNVAYSKINSRINKPKLLH